MSKNSLALVFILILFISPSHSGAASFGPEEWHQYRLNSDKNAVFNNGSEPLEYRIFETAHEVRATPVIAGNKLFVGNHKSGDLFAFDVNTGEELWHNKAPNWIHSEMIYHDGAVFVGFGNRFFKDNGIRGTEESGVLALDAKTGDVLWKFNTDGEVMPTPAYYKGSLYVTTGDKHLYKLNTDNGELLHKAKIGSTVSMSSPNITEDTLYVGGSGPLPYTFSAYNLTSDEFKWQTEFDKVVAGLDDVPPAVFKNSVVTTAVEGSYENPEHFIYTLDTETGEIVWKESMGTGDMVKNNKSGAPIIYDGKVFVGSPITKTFYSYDLNSGEKLWEFKNEIMKAPPAAEDGIVYFSNTQGMIYALDSDTGDVVGKKELNGTLAPSGPIIINDTLFVGSQDSNVYSMPLTDIVESEQTEQTTDKEDNGVINFIIIGVLAITLIGLLLKVIINKKS